MLAFDRSKAGLQLGGSVRGKLARDGQNQAKRGTGSRRAAARPQHRPGFCSRLNHALFPAPLSRKRTANPNSHSTQTTGSRGVEKRAPRQRELADGGATERPRGDYTAKDDRTACAALATARCGTEPSWCGRTSRCPKPQASPCSRHPVINGQFMVFRFRLDDGAFAFFVEEIDPSAGDRSATR